MGDSVIRRGKKKDALYMERLASSFLGRGNQDRYDGGF